MEGLTDMPAGWAPDPKAGAMINMSWRKGALLVRFNYKVDGFVLYRQVPARQWRSQIHHRTPPDAIVPVPNCPVFQEAVACMIWAEVQADT